MNYIIPIESVFNTIDKHGLKKGTKIVATSVGIGVFAAGIYVFIQKKINGHEQRKTIKTQTQGTIEIDTVKTDNNIREQHAATDDKIAIIQAETDAKIKVNKAKADYRNQSKNNGSTELPPEQVAAAEMPPTYNGIIASRDSESDEDTRIFTPWLNWYEIGGLVGLTHGGKSVCARQIAENISLGYQRVRLFPEWVDGAPVPVLLVALEHNKKHVRSYDANLHKDLPNLRILTGADVSSLVDLKARIERTANEYPKGLVVIIDNYAKLKSLAQGGKGCRKELVAFGQWIETLRNRRLQENKPFYCLNVYHTTKGFRPSNPLELQDVAGDADYTRFSQEFIALSSCKRGKDYRILKVLKNKYCEDRDTVSILRYADTEDWNFEYVEEACEEDELPPRYKSKTESTSTESTKRGRPQTQSDEAIIEIYNKVKSGELKSADVYGIYGIGWKAVKKRWKGLQQKSEAA